MSSVPAASSFHLSPRQSPWLPYSPGCSSEQNKGKRSNSKASRLSFAPYHCVGSCCELVQSASFLLHAHQGCYSATERLSPHHRNKGLILGNLKLIIVCMSRLRRTKRSNLDDDRTKKLTRESTTPPSLIPLAAPTHSLSRAALCLSLQRMRKDVHPAKCPHGPPPYPHGRETSCMRSLHQGLVSVCGYCYMADIFSD